MKRFFKVAGPKNTSADRGKVGLSRSTLEDRYGRPGKIIGTGSNSVVRLLERPKDGTMFAVKQFRPLHLGEDPEIYAGKINKEFLVGVHLHHGNIIQMVDLIWEKRTYFQVMEYAQFDLFEGVMTGMMSKEEIACCMLQVLSGVTYMHSMGVAHRDLKLNNVVINSQGILKVTDFGSAIVCRRAGSPDVILATGVAGSEAYLAPEVYLSRPYNPFSADTWSLAIMFCSMTLRRFPWKLPRLEDVSYKCFVGLSPPVLSPQGRTMSHENAMTLPDHWLQRRQAQQCGDDLQDRLHRENPQAVIEGPKTLLRLLPRESRFIIGRMLEVDPHRRATLEDVLIDEWIRTSPACRQMEDGSIFKAQGHVHTLRSPSMHR